MLFLLVGILGGYVLRDFFPAYFHKKGENLATKEDIADITDEVENVRSLYASQLQDLQHRNELLLEQVRSRQQLRMAALEKRLQAHQDAYTLWRKLRINLSSPNISSIVSECQEFVDRNCLYLDHAARVAFINAWSAADVHHVFLATGKDAATPEERAAISVQIRENADIVMKAGAAILSGVELPTLGELEAEDITEKTTRDSQKDAG
jgi:hypothetical protein